MDHADPTKNVAVLAVDIGGPIIRQRGRATEGAAEGIKMLVERRFGPRAHLISQCDERMESERRMWLEAQKFYERSGVLPKNVHFCRQGEEKAEACARLGVTHYVENAIAVMMHAMRTVPNLYLYHPNREECNRYPPFMKLVFNPLEHGLEETATRPILRVERWDQQPGRFLITHILESPILKQNRDSMDFSTLAPL